MEPLTKNDLVECDICGCALRNDREMMDLHDVWHAEIERIARQAAQSPDPRLWSSY